MRDRSPFAGELSFIGLAEIFQILGGNGSSGVLNIRSPYADSPGVIYFEGGNPINAAFGALYGIDAVYALFGLTEGSFEFRRERVYAGRVIEQSRMQIVLDALRMLDDGLIEKLGPMPDSEKISETEKSASGMIIRRPFLDYLYIIDEEEFPDGETIVKEGAHGKWIWVILEGMVDISRETGTGPITVARLAEGSFIGTIKSFLFSEYIRSATVTAVGRVRLGLLDSQRLHEEFSMFSPDFRGLILSMAGRLGKITDRAVKLSTDRPGAFTMDPEKRAIIEKGSRSEGAYAIVYGEMDVVGETAKGYVPLIKLERNDVFGNVPFLDIGHEPDVASIWGSSDVELRPVDVHGMQQEYNNLTDTLKHLIEHSCQAISVTTRRVLRMVEGG